MELTKKQMVMLSNKIANAQENRLECEDNSCLHFTDKVTYGYTDFTFSWKTLSFRTFESMFFQQTEFLREEEAPLLVSGFELLKKVILGLVVVE